MQTIFAGQSHVVAELTDGFDILFARLKYNGQEQAEDAQADAREIPRIRLHVWPRPLPGAYRRGEGARICALWIRLRVLLSGQQSSLDPGWRAEDGLLDWRLPTCEYRTLIVYMYMYMYTYMKALCIPHTTTTSSKTFPGT